MASVKGSKHFTEKSYTDRRDLVVTLIQAGVSRVKIAKTLNMGQSTIHLMEKYDWRQYEEYKKAKHQKQKATRIAKVALEQESSNEAELASGWTPAPKTQIDLEETVDSIARNLQYVVNKVTKLSNDIDELLDKEDTKPVRARFFNGRNT